MSAENAFERARDVFRRRRGVAFAVFVVAAAGGASFSAALPDVYRASGTLLVERPEATPSNGGAPSDVDARLLVLRQKVLSRLRLEELIEELHLYPTMRARGVPTEVIAERMRREINVEMGASGSAAPVFRITYWGDHPATVAAVCNALARAFIDEDSGSQRQHVSGVVKTLRAQLADAKARLDAQEDRISDFKRRYGAELPQQAETNLATIQRLNTLLSVAVETQNRALERRAGLQQRLAEAERAPQRPGESPAQRVSRLRLRLADLQRSYGDKYPDVVSLRNELATAEEALAATPEQSTRSVDPIASQIQQIDADVRQAKIEEQEVRGQLAAYQRKVEAAPAREQQFLELSRDYATTRGLYEALLKRSEEAQLAASPGESAPGKTFRVLDQALVPQFPAGPNRIALGIGSLVLALLLSIGAMTLAEQMDDSLHSPEEVHAFSGVPVLVCVPRLDRGWMGRGRRILALAPVLLVAVAAAEVARRLALLDTPIASLLARGRF